jgi:hypothetical protein
MSTDMSSSPEAYPHTLNAYKLANGPEAHDAGTHATQLIAYPVVASDSE